MSLQDFQINYYKRKKWNIHKYPKKCYKGVQVTQAVKVDALK